MQVYFSQSQREPVNSAAHARGYSTGGRKGAFLAGSPRYLRNIWVEQLIATQICAISGLSSAAGENYTIFSVRVNWQNCAILEPSRLPYRIVQFLEGKVGFPSGMRNFQGESTKPAAGSSLCEQPVRGMD